MVAAGLLSTGCFGPAENEANLNANTSEFSLDAVAEAIVVDIDRAIACGDDTPALTTAEVAHGIQELFESDGADTTLEAFAADQQAFWSDRADVQCAINVGPSSDGG